MTSMYASAVYLPSGLDYCKGDEEARKSRLLKARLKPMLFSEEFVLRLILEICLSPGVPWVVPGFEARKVKSAGWATSTL